MFRGLCNIPHMNGTCHGEDIPLLFRTKMANRFVKGNDNYDVQQKLLGTFTQFVKAGNPNCSLIKKSKWNAIPKKDIKSFKCMNMGSNEWKMEVLPNLEKLMVWHAVHETNGVKAKF